MQNRPTDPILSDARLTMAETARACGGVAVSTVWRWTLKGVRGVRLRTVHLGGRRYVLRSDLDAFLAAINGGALTADGDRAEGGAA